MADEAVAVAIDLHLLTGDEFHAPIRLAGLRRQLNHPACLVGAGGRKWLECFVQGRGGVCAA